MDRADETSPVASPQRPGHFHPTTVHYRLLGVESWSSCRWERWQLDACGYNVPGSQIEHWSDGLKVKHKRNFPPDASHGTQVERQCGGRPESNRRFNQAGVCIRMLIDFFFFF